jgi:hypothetical protein
MKTKRTKWRRKEFGIAMGCTLMLIAVESCSRQPENIGDVDNSTLLDSGAVLAKQYCGSCHMLPSPEMLDKKTWIDQTLPSMGNRFGIYADRTRDSLIEKGMGGRIVRAANIFPANQIITEQEWEQIVAHYHHNAPETLSEPDGIESLPTSRHFKPIIPSFRIPRPGVTALAYDSAKRQLYVANYVHNQNNTVTILDEKFQPITTLGVKLPVSNLTLKEDILYMLLMGHFVPSDEPVGQLIKAIKDKEGNYLGYKLVLTGLKRPVDIAYADLDNDGDEDIVVCEFGNHTGSVSLFMRDGNGKYMRESLNEAPGAVRVLVTDFNADKKMDIIVLMAQGDEGVDIYYNEGNSRFRKDRVLRFSPLFGSSSLLLLDINKDGFLDIICTNGDNADASQVIKPYHGIRLYMNNKNNQFNEAFFYNLPGAYKAAATDFDHDGDVDIGVVSFFPDFVRHPEKGFIFLENISTTDSLKFAPTLVPRSKTGRWITMIGADTDGDGFEDLILGSFSLMSIAGDPNTIAKKEFESSSVPLLLLNNVSTIKK